MPIDHLEDIQEFECGWLFDGARSADHIDTMYLVVLY